MIKLGYLKGYNSYNVPSFASKQARDTFFDSITGLVEIDAYYPPFYTNVIKLDITQVSQSVPYNFVILVHNDEYYYYFIDKFNYINEELYEIIINMDTALTIMFDVKIKDCVVTRRSMPRWVENNNEYLINRDYIRENLSEGFFEVNTFTKKDTCRWYVINKSADEGVPNTVLRFKNENLYDIGYEILLYPMPEDFPSNENGWRIFAIYDDISQQYLNIGEYMNGHVGDYADNPETINMYMVNNQALDDVLQAYYTNEVVTYLGDQYNARVLHIGCRLEIHENSTYDETYLIRPEYVVNHFKIAKIFLDINNIEDNYVQLDNTFVRNTASNTLFDKRYIPQLIDENYIQILYGKNKGFISYPLHQSTKAEYKCFTTVNLTTADEVYAIGFYNNISPEFVVYNTSSTCEGTQMELITDAWKMYQAQNKGTLTTGLKLQYTNTMYKTATSTVNSIAGMVSGSLGANILKLKTNSWNNPPTTYDKFRHLQQQQNIASSAIGGVEGITDGLMQAYNIKKNYDINKENLEYTPDVSKGTSNSITELINDYDVIFIKQLVINDIEAVAKKLELYGYKTNKTFVFQVPLYINDIQKFRKYYNVLEMKINDYELLKMIPNDIINDFTDRLSRGIRLFDMTYNTNLSDNLIYDNVETEEII